MTLMHSLLIFWPGLDGTELLIVSETRAGFHE